MSDCARSERERISSRSKARRPFPSETSISLFKRDRGVKKVIN